MVFVIAFVALVGFVFVMGAAYAGTMRALEVYFDPEQHSVFLSSSHRPPTDDRSPGPGPENGSPWDDR